MLILKCDDVHVTTMQLFESETHALIVINRALVGGHKFQLVWVFIAGRVIE